MAQQPLVAHGLFITGASQSHSDRPHSVGLLWTGDQHDNTQILEEKTFMLPAGFEPAIPASEGPQTHALDRAATGIDRFFLMN